MTSRGWLVVAMLAIVVGWWYSDVSPRVPEPARLHDGRAAPGCPQPPPVQPGGAPLQTPAPSTLAPFALEGATLTPLAGISIDARVLSRRNYRIGAAARLSPTDLALGWQEMARDEILERLSISQSSRWYQYRWRGEPPLPPATIASRSANMHLIPASRRVAQSLARVRNDQRVRIDGWLVEARIGDDTWRSSITREDTGDGACELVYVCALTAIP